MTRILTNIEKSLVDAALEEMGVDEMAAERSRRATDTETLEENLIEVAFAEAADFADIHAAILLDHLKLQDIAHPDDCQYGDNETCFA